MSGPTSVFNLVQHLPEKIDRFLDIYNAFMTKSLEKHLFLLYFINYVFTIFKAITEAGRNFFKVFNEVFVCLNLLNSF